MGPGDLQEALKGLHLKQDRRLLVGVESGDDAGVYQLNENTCIIQTLDFITPIVDDPFVFGGIAAANALSDIYAMGGKPLCAMNIVGFPTNTLPISILIAILQGGIEKIHEAEALLIGGHTVDDSELKYGLSVTGIVHPEKIVTNSHALPGDLLILTKALGTGIISTAQKGKMVSKVHMNDAIASMLSLNRSASEQMVEIGANACTDITGFSLLGHAVNMAKSSGVTISFDSRKIPLLNGVEEYASQGLIPGGAYRNEKYFSKRINVAGPLTKEQLLIFYDPQTSGGLLISIARDKAELLLKRLRNSGINQATIVGEVISKKEYDVIIH